MFTSCQSCEASDGDVIDYVARVARNCKNSYDNPRCDCIAIKRLDGRVRLEGLTPCVLFPCALSSCGCIAAGCRVRKSLELCTGLNRTRADVGLGMIMNSKCSRSHDLQMRTCKLALILCACRHDREFNRHRDRQDSNCYMYTIASRYVYILNL